MSDVAIIWAVGLTLTLVATLPVVRRLRSKEQRSEAADLEALRYGLKEPATLSPQVSPEICIGIGNCTAVCPEGDVLGVRSGQAYAVMPARCIGHGLCERACPVEAIQLVFGSEKRGVDIPRIQENFETNVPGIYIIGELGGMGLIRNAFEQGRQCIEGIAEEPSGPDASILDLVIVGCGPAGLSASLNAKRCGMRFVTLERDTVGGTVAHYPRKKLVMTQPVKVPGYGKIGAREIGKEALMETWLEIIREAGLEVRINQEVTSISQRPGGGFDVHTSAEVFSANRVILAIGRRGVPRKLGVPGEDLSKVSYSLREPEVFAGDRVLVVGGGDSAIEAAMVIAEQKDSVVHLSYRRSSFSRIKPANHERIHEAVERGLLKVLWETNLRVIDEDAVMLTATDTEMTLGNDQVLVFAGGILPTGFLESCGIMIDTKFGAP